METVNHIFHSCHFASAARQCTSHLFGINFVPNGSPLTFFLQALKASFSKQVMALLLSGIASCFSSIGMPRICVCMRGFWFLCIRFSLLSDKLLERLINSIQTGWMQNSVDELLILHRLHVYAVPQKASENYSG